MEESLASERDLLAQELINIFGAIVRKSEYLLLIILIRKLFRISIFAFPKASVVFFQFIQQLLLEALSC